MAQGTKQARNDQMQRRDQGMERRNRGTFDRGTSQWDPFSLMNSFRQEMDRFLDDFGFGQAGFGSSMSTNWMPTTEVFERGNELVFRADLPGLSKEDVDVDIDEEQITIRGERKSEHEENRQGIFRSERHYGTFFRSIPLPPGADAEQAKANFRNGVLEITIPKPERSGARKLEIEENSR
jgi:HSP20 family protein